MLFIFTQTYAKSGSEQARASHILVDTEEEIDSILAELQKADDLPAAFAAKAKEVSKCPSGKSAGGDLGTFGRGMMVPEFDKVVFTEPLNIPVKVKTQFGYHLVLITERSGEDHKHDSEL